MRRQREAVPSMLRRVCCGRGAAAITSLMACITGNHGESSGGQGSCGRGSLRLARRRSRRSCACLARRCLRASWTVRLMTRMP